MVVEFAGESAAHRYLVDYKGEACMRPVLAANPASAPHQQGGIGSHDLSRYGDARVLRP
jgi:hypothetical protein